MAVSRRKTLNFIGAGVTCADNSSTAATDCTISGGGGGGGSSILLDLGDDGFNESTALGEIAVTGDTNSIFSEPTADKLLIAVGNDWPKSDLADAATALAADPTDCGANQYATTIAASGNLTCAQVGFNQLSGTATDAQIPDTITVNNATAAGTATALAANPTDCSLNQYATTIDAGGNLTCAQVAFSQLSGTASDAQIPNNITVDLATAATALAANGANCSAGSFPLGVDASGAVESCSSSITGNAATATALAANGANCTAGSFPLGVDASGAVESCSSSITGNAATATALAANGGNCSAGNYPLGVDASGAVESCTADDDVPESGDFGNLTGGAGITVSAGTVATASGETDFLATGALTCGAGTKGRMQVHTTPLQYCDNAATPTLQYAAYGNSTGQATDLACSSCLTSAELAGIVSDETGTAGKVVFDTSPTFQTDITTPLIYGSAASGGDLTLQSTSHATRGTIDAADQIRLSTASPSLNGGSDKWAMRSDVSLTGNALGWYSVLGVDGVYTNPGAVYLFSVGSFYTDILSSGASGRFRLDYTSGSSISPFVALNAVPYFRANGATITSGTPTLLTLAPIYETANSGAMSGVTHTDINSTLAAGSGVTGIHRKHLMFNDATGSGTVGDQFAVDVAALTKGTTNAAVRSATVASSGRYFLLGTGDAQSVHPGKLMVGSTSDPTARLHVSEPTIGNEVVRFESVATNDDPAWRLFQARATAAASGTTNIDFNLTTAACAASHVCNVEVSTVCHCTSGSSCTSNQGGGHTSKWVTKNNGGTISQIGATASGNILNAVDASLTSITTSISSPNIRTAIVVPANYNHTCHVNVAVQDVGT